MHYLVYNTSFEHLALTESSYLEEALSHINPVSHKKITTKLTP